MLLQVEKAGSALDVSQRLRSSQLLPLEDLSRTERPLELADELFKVVLHHPVECHQVAIEIVQHLHRCGLGTHEEQGGATSKNFDVAFMRGKEWDQAVGQAAFAAHPGDDWRCHW